MEKDAGGKLTIVLVEGSALVVEETDVEAVVELVGFAVIICVPTASGKQKKINLKFSIANNMARYLLVMTEMAVLLVHQKS